jgi:hypothetical protein
MRRDFLTEPAMNASRPIALALVVATAVPAVAQQQPANRPAPRRIEGMSEEGNAIFARAQVAPDPDLLGLVRQQRLVRDQLSAAALQPTIKVDEVEALLRKSEDLQSQIRNRNNDRMLAVLRELPEEDRVAFLRGILPKPGAR